MKSKRIKRTQLFVFIFTNDVFAPLYNDEVIKVKSIIKYIFSALSGAIINLLGGWDIWLTSLVALMATDVSVGIIKASMHRSDKSINGGLSSASMFRGGMRKILVLILVALGTLLDRIIGPDSLYIRSTVAGYYIANETLSILENIAACGVPLPKVLYSALDVLKKKDSDSNPDDNT